MCAVTTAHIERGALDMHARARSKPYFVPSFKPPGSCAMADAAAGPPMTTRRPYQDYITWRSMGNRTFWGKVMKHPALAQEFVIERLVSLKCVNPKETTSADALAVAMVVSLGSMSEAIANVSESEVCSKYNAFKASSCVHFCGLWDCGDYRNPVANVGAFVCMSACLQARFKQAAGRNTDGTYITLLPRTPADLFRQYPEIARANFGVGPEELPCACPVDEMLIRIVLGKLSMRGQSRAKSMALQTVPNHLTMQGLHADIIGYCHACMHCNACLVQNIILRAVSTAYK